WFDTVLLRYGEPQRFYHTLSHVDRMLFLLSKYGDGVQKKIVVMLAIFFHDIVYNPERNDNEIQSIELFKLFARDAELPKETIEYVSAFIGATITHSMDASLSALNNGEDLKLFLDFDLEVLSREESQYQAYAEQIRMEYNNVCQREYYIGRIKILSSFLDRKRIYFSDIFYDTCEINARRNVTNELEALQ
ncbi:hypothetical protein B0O99DRAFT_493431, partial [Bisporella sp. PMI_857]